MSESKGRRLKICLHCKCWIDPAFGADPPTEHQEAEGTRADPRAPGDYEVPAQTCERPGPVHDWIAEEVSRA